MNIQDTLRKMIEHEKSARKIGNQAEAEAFAGKIQELLLKHKLEMSDIEIAEQERNEPILEEWFSIPEVLDLPIKRRHDTWFGLLLSSITRANFCKVLQTHVSNTYTIVGRESDRDVSKQLFEYLSKACIEMAPHEALKHFGPSPVRGMKHPEERTFISSFKVGFAVAICNRLHVKMEELKAGATEQGLIRVDQLTKATEEKFDELHPETRKTAPPRVSSYSGFQSGKEYGSAVGINSIKRLTS